MSTHLPRATLPREQLVSRLPLPTLEQVAQPVTLCEVLWTLEIPECHADEIAAACRLPNGALHVVLRGTGR